MLRHHVLAALRSFRRYRGHSALSLLGLTLGTTVFLLIALWVYYQWSFDRFHVNGDNIYRVILGYEETTGIDEAVAPLPLGPALKDDYSEFTAYTRFLRTALPLLHDGETYLERGSFVDPDFLTMFSFPLVTSDGRANLLEPGSIVLSESLARRMFGDKDPIGQSIGYDESNSFLVTGVVKDPPPNSHLQFNYLTNITFGAQWGLDFDSWSDISYSTYVMVQPGVSQATVNKRIVECHGKHEPTRRDSYYSQNLRDIYLYSGFKFDYVNLGSISQVRLLGAAGILILLLACLNHMGLSTVKLTRRASEVGIRKVVGAGRTDLVACFLVESMLTSTVALSVSVVLAEVLLPSMNAVAGTEIHLRQLVQFPLLASVVVVFLLTGVLTALYPAYWFARLRPAAVIGGKYSHGPKGTNVRRILVGVQFVIAALLITATLVVYRQLTYVHNKDLGYDRDWVLSISLRGPASAQWELLKERLNNNPGVLATTALSSLPTSVSAGTSGTDWEGRAEGQRVQMQFIDVDYDFVDAFRMKMAEGRFYSREFVSDTATGYVINEAAARAMGMSPAVGKRFTFDVNGTIIGVVKDFNYASLRSPIEPLIMCIKPSGWHVGYRHLCVRIAPNQAAQVIIDLQRIWREMFPDTQFEYSFLDNQVTRLYESEVLVGKLLSVFTALALLIAGLGLFSLVALAVAGRTKEIGVRKVLGASTSSVILILGREYAALVVIANAVAWPIAYYTMSRWLEGFVYRVRFDAWIFLLGGALVLLTAAATVGWQAFRAARANPVEALRYE